MHVFLFCLALGVIGLLIMAVGGVGRHGGHGAHGGHAHLAARHSGGQATGAHHVGHHLSGSQARGGRVGARPVGSGVAGSAAPATAGRSLTRTGASWLATIASPRVAFSLLTGFGATGAFLGHLLVGPALYGSAVLGALGFERLLVTPIWNQMMRFASEPAETLESCIASTVRAVTTFDVRGQGLVLVELDGQLTQILATLRPEDRAGGVRVQAGDTLRVEDVDSARNRCIVSPLVHQEVI